MRKVKCPMCGQLNNKSDTEMIGKRYYCIPCAEEKRERAKRNKDDWDELFNYICELYNIDKPTGMMFGQLKRYREEPYNFTNKGMLLTLKYFYEVLGNEVKDSTGLGIIEYEYENAKRHYMDVLRVKLCTEKFEQDDGVREVKITPNLRSKAKVKQLSFDNIPEEEDIDEATFD